MAKKILKFTMTGVNAPDYIEKTFFQDTRKINDAYITLEKHLP